MNQKSIGCLGLVIVSIASLAWAAPPTGTVPASKDPSLTPRRIVGPCRTDLAIETISISQTSNPNLHKLTVNIVNLGPNSAFVAPAALINVRVQTFADVRGRQVPVATLFSSEDITYVVRGPGLAFDFELPSGTPTTTASQIIAAINIGPDGPPTACDANRANDTLTVPAVRLQPWLARPVGTLVINRGY